MKRTRTAAFLAVAIYTILTTACEKEVSLPEEVPVNLGRGRASIQFTASHDFAGSKDFSIANTESTTADRLLALNGRNIVLTATEMNGSSPKRKVLIDINVANDQLAQTNLSLIWSKPSTSIRLISYSAFGGFMESQTNTLVFNKITPTEVEGTFTATFDGGITIKNGKFAGKF